MVRKTENKPRHTTRTISPVSFRVRFIGSRRVRCSVLGITCHPLPTDTFDAVTIDDLAAVLALDGIAILRLDYRRSIRGLNLSSAFRTCSVAFAHDSKPLDLIEHTLCAAMLDCRNPQRPRTRRWTTTPNRLLFCDVFRLRQCVFVAHGCFWLWWGPVISSFAENLHAASVAKVGCSDFLTAGTAMEILDAVAAMGVGAPFISCVVGEQP